MNLEYYLEQIRHARDRNLRKEWGIYDNYVIFIGADFDKLNKFMRTFEKFKLSEMKSNDKDKVFYDYNDGTVSLQTINRLAAFAIDGQLERNSLEIAHYEVQTSKFQTSLILHPYQQQKINGLSDKRAMAVVIGELCTELAFKYNIPFCLPHSVGSKYYNPEKDLDRIVYSPISLCPDM